MNKNEKPPPGEPPDPGIVASFIAALGAKTWSANHLVDPLSGSAMYPAVVASRTWPTAGEWGLTLLSSNGVLLSLDTYTKLKSAVANADGSFTPRGGVRSWLASQSGWAVPVPA